MAGRRSFFTTARVVALTVALLVPSISLLHPAPATSFGIIRKVAGGGVGDTAPALSMFLYRPWSMVPDTKGGFYLSSEYDDRIRYIDNMGLAHTIAGNGFEGYSGDGGKATLARMWAPRGIALAANGDLFIADTGNNRIRKVDVNGNITTIAGTGQRGYNGDGIPATQAMLSEPYWVAVDPTGNIYIADTTNFRVRKVSTNGIISTVAGDGSPCAGPCPSGVADSEGIGDGGPATSAHLRVPSGVALDSAGNIYIADTNRHRIRRVGSNGIITTWAGGGTSTADGIPATQGSLFFPESLTFDRHGNAFIADRGAQRVKKVSTSGILTTVAGRNTCCFGGDGGPAIDALFSNPRGVALDASDNLYIADTENHRVRKVDASTGIVRTVAGTGSLTFAGDLGKATEALLAKVRGIVRDTNGNIYFSDTLNARVRKIDISGTITTYAGIGTAGLCGDGGLAVNACLNNPAGLALDASGNLYIADTGNNRIRVVAAATGRISSPSFASQTIGVASTLSAPGGVAVGASGSILVADTGRNRVVKISGTTLTVVAGGSTAGYSGDGGLAATSLLDGPQGVAVDADGNVYIADTNNDRIRMVDALGTIQTVAGGTCKCFRGDGGPPTAAGLHTPTSVSVNSSGDIVVSDTGNHRIRVVRLNTYRPGVLGLRIVLPYGGTISTLAGNGNAGLSGDGGSATSASLNAPGAAVMDANGYLYIADSENSRVRQVV